MEMKVDGHLIRSHRERRAWSQEHLARASGLGLRTIQRIESSGLASQDSVKALAAVFEVPVTQLFRTKSFAGGIYRFKRPLVRRASLALASMTVVGSVFLATGVLAKDVMLTVGLEHNGVQVSSPRLATADGREAEIRVAGVMRLIITPTIQANGNVYLATKIYRSKGDGFVLVSEPEVATEDRKPTEIRLTSDTGDSFNVRITPAVQ